MSTLLSELLGNSQIDHEAAAQHLEFMFEPGDLVHITGIRQDKNKLRGKQAGVITMGGMRDEICAGIRSGDLESLAPVEVENPWNIYYSINPTSEVVDGLKRRPNQHHASGVRQMFGDIDIKDGSFETQAEIQAYIDGLPIQPNCISWTGSGGAHISWLVDERDYAAFFEDTKAPQKWWAWMVEHAEGRGIDPLTDPRSRVLRLPGTTRWPKEAMEIPAQVRAEYRDVPLLTKAAFDDAVKEPYRIVSARVEKRRRLDRAKASEALSEFGVPMTWGERVAMASVDEVVAEHYSWDDVLAPHGWTYFRDGADGSRWWTRPGKPTSDKSATTDWPESPEVMKLFSADPDTGLWDLEEAKIPLTKWRCLLRLHFNDDVVQATRHIAELMNERS